MNKIEKLLKTDAKKVNTEMSYMVFLKFAEHFKINEETEAKAWEDFLKLKEMGISLELAINTSIALARM